MWLHWEYAPERKKGAPLTELKAPADNAAAKYFCSDWSSVINSVIHLSLGDLTED